jgi:hypothetical protein
MRVGNGDGFETAELLDGGKNLVIQKGHAIPEDIALARLHKQGALTYGEGWFGADAGEVRLVLFDDLVIAFCLHSGKRRPLLPIIAHVLPLIQANGTLRRRRLALRVLHTTGNTNPVFHAMKLLSLLENYAHNISIAYLRRLLRRISNADRETIRLLQSRYIRGGRRSLCFWDCCTRE